MPERRTNADVILAGVRSCLIAIDTIDELEHDTHPRPQAMVSAARQVLNDWGIDVKPQPREPVPIPDVDPPPVAGVVPAVQEPAPHAELKWPPPHPTLPAVYTENYYHPRQSLLAWLAQDGDGSIVAGEPTIRLETIDMLVFKGRAFWEQLAGCWMMRMERLPAAFTTTTMHVWVLSKVIKPGDEIPVVIDAQAQAKSTDP